VLVAYPLVFDWMFVYWYFVRFAAKVRRSASPPRSMLGAMLEPAMYTTRVRPPVE